MGLNEKLTDEEFDEYADKVMDMGRSKIQWIAWQLMRSSDKETIDKAMRSAEENVNHDE